MTMQMIFDLCSSVWRLQGSAAFLFAMQYVMTYQAFPSAALQGECSCSGAVGSSELEGGGEGTERERGQKGGRGSR